MSQTQAILTKAKKASKKESLIASGYIRLNGPGLITSGIIQICLAFYAFLDQWDQNNKSNKIKIYGECDQFVTSLLDNSKRANNYQTILGVRRVSKGIHHWKLKIVEHYDHNGSMQGFWRLTVGVIRINDKTLINDEQKMRNVYDH